MRQISPHTRDLIQQLRGPVGSRDYVAILSEIGDSNEPAAIGDVLHLILSRDDVAFAAAAALHKLLLGTTPTELAWLDSTLRQRSMYFGPDFYEWHKISPRNIDELERFGNASVSLLSLASFHQNGYVREAAIRKLSLVTTGAEVPFLILRLNDWVSNVRDAAYTAVRSRIKPEYCQSFISSLTLLSRLEYAGRADHKDVLTEVYRLLQSDECRTTLLESLNSEDRFIRRASFQLALQTTNSNFEHVVTEGLNDRDTLIRRLAAQKVSAFDGATLEHFLNRMKRDRFMPVRREAFRISIQVSPHNAVDELRNALLDPHQSIREEFRYLLKKTQPIDVAAFYREHLTAGSTLYGAITGLGETGRTNDDRLIAPYATDPSSKVRSAALRALTKLNPAAHVNIFANALKDEVPHVSRQAQTALTQKGSLLNPDAAWEIFKSASQVHVKRNALSVIEKLNKWDSIELLIKALSDTDEGIVEVSRRAIARWLAQFNRTFTAPRPEQLRKLRHTLDQRAHLIGEQTKEQLLFLMKGYG